MRRRVAPRPTRQSSYPTPTGWPPLLSSSRVLPATKPTRTAARAPRPEIPWRGQYRAVRTTSPRSRGLASPCSRRSLQGTRARVPLLDDSCLRDRTGRRQPDTSPATGLTRYRAIPQFPANRPVWRACPRESLPFVSPEHASWPSRLLLSARYDGRRRTASWRAPRVERGNRLFLPTRETSPGRPPPHRGDSPESVDKRQRPCRHACARGSQTPLRHTARRIGRVVPGLSSRSRFALSPVVAGGCHGRTNDYCLPKGSYLQHSFAIFVILTKWDRI